VIFRRWQVLGSAAFGAIGVGAFVGLILLVLHFGCRKPKANAAPAPAPAEPAAFHRYKRAEVVRVGAAGVKKVDIGAR
jgi:hypothetical protein